MTNEQVDVFFYGSFMDPNVLLKYDLHPCGIKTASLTDYSIGFTPMATIFSSPRSVVWGVICGLPSSQLEQAYRVQPLSEYDYYAKKISISTVDGERHAAIVYLTDKPIGFIPERPYVENIIRIATEHKFPEEYLRLLQSFLEKK